LTRLVTFSDGFTSSSAPTTPADSYQSPSNWPAIRPVLLLDFSNGRTLDPKISITRSSTATRVNEKGVIETVPANQPRFDHDPTTLESLGLLIEEQRTNLFLNSETLSTQSVTVTAAAHTVSFTGTGSITFSGAYSGTLSGTSATTKVSLTFTPSAGSLTATVSGSVKYSNCELGSWATSWIPTTGSTATRNADLVSLTGTNFSSWFRSDEGTVLVSGRGVNNSDTAAGRVFRIVNSGDTTQRIESYITNAGNITSQIFNGTTQDSDTFSYTVGDSFTHALAFKLNDCAAAFNGSTPTTDTSAAMPTGLNTLYLGGNASAGDYLGGHIKKFCFFPLRLTNAQLTAVTSV
jgi:hypothetical protein